MRMHIRFFPASNDGLVWCTGSAERLYPVFGLCNRHSPLFHYLHTTQAWVIHVPAHYKPLCFAHDSDAMTRIVVSGRQSPSAYPIKSPTLITGSAQQISDILLIPFFFFRRPGIYLYK